MHRDSNTRKLETETLSGLRQIVLGLATCLLVASPLVGIGYIQLAVDPQRVFHSHLFHELAILLATAIGLLVTGFALASYRSSGEPLQRWLTLALLGFTLVYAPHGAFTRAGMENPALFLLYGPASRLVIAAFLLVALIHRRAWPDEPSKRLLPRHLLLWTAFFLVIDAVIAAIALSPSIPHGQVRFMLEGCALLLGSVALLTLLVQIKLPRLLRSFATAIALFAQSSVSFFLAQAWNYQWWFAHAIFAGGFFVIGFGVLRAYLTAPDISEAFSDAP